MVKKEPKTNRQISQFDLFSKTKLSVQINVNSGSQSTVYMYIIFVYSKIIKWHIGYGPGVIRLCMILYFTILLTYTCHNHKILTIIKYLLTLTSWNPQQPPKNRIHKIIIIMANSNSHIYITLMYIITNLVYFTDFLRSIY